MHPALLIDTSGIISKLHFGFMAMLVTAVVLIGIEALVLWSMRRNDFRTSIKQAFLANAASGGCMLIYWWITKPMHLLDMITPSIIGGLPGFLLLTILMESGVLLLLQRQESLRRTLLAALAMKAFSGLIVSIPVAIPFAEFLVVRSDLGLLTALLLLLLPITALETILLLLLNRNTPFGAIVLDSFLANATALLCIAIAWSFLTTQNHLPFAESGLPVWIGGLLIFLSAQTAVLTLRRREQIIRKALRAAFVANALMYPLIIAPLMQFKLTL